MFTYSRWSYVNNNDIIDGCIVLLASILLHV